jgi:hypothetical protein
VLSVESLHTVGSEEEEEEEEEEEDFFLVNRELDVNDDPTVTVLSSVGGRMIPSIKSGLDVPTKDEESPEMEVMEVDGHELLEL